MPEPFLVIQVADKRCAIRAASIQEIVHVAATGRIPGQPSILHGFLNLRGQMLPVLSLRALFGEQAAEPDLYAPIIVVRDGGRPLALLADDVLETAAVEGAAMEPVRDHQTVNDCAEACFQSPDGPVTVILPDRLLLAKERECLAALQERIAARLEEAEGTRG